MKSTIYIKCCVAFLLIATCFSCEEFVEVSEPDSQLIREQVFGSDATAISAMQGIYNELFQLSFSGGSRNSVGTLAGLSADNLENIYTSNLSRMEFQENEISPDNSDNLDLWSGAYNMIYMCNSFLEGIATSEEIDSALATQLEGEARFVRAFTYFNLVNLYGDVPLVLSTSYKDNERAMRISRAEVYEQILNDLSFSVEVLQDDYRNGERYIVNRYAAIALQARIYLYLEDWQMAESMSTQVIEASSMYELLPDLNRVFKANSREAIWQISPIGGGGIVTHTKEGELFIIDPFFNFFASLQLEQDFIDNFQENDLRFINWIGYDSGLDAYFPYKYKIDYSTTFPIEEYSMVIRLAELYLIRAEARAEQGKLEQSLADINTIRNRAAIDLITMDASALTTQALLNLVSEERRKELFTEWGHRWFDLKRTNRASEVLGESNPLWQDTDVLFPIPSEERQKNPNLDQNPGY